MTESNPPLSPEQLQIVFNGLLEANDSLQLIRDKLPKSADDQPGEQAAAVGRVRARVKGLQCQVTTLLSDMRDAFVTLP